MTEEELKEDNAKEAERKRNERKNNNERWKAEDISKIIENREKATIRQQKCRAASKQEISSDSKINSIENDKNKFHHNYENESNFNCCAVCAFESGMQDMEEITEKVKEYFVSSGIQALYLKRIAEYKLTRDPDFVKSLENETNEYGVLKYYKTICRKCYNTIRPKNRKQKQPVIVTTDDYYDLNERRKFGFLIYTQQMILKKNEYDRTAVDLKFLADHSEAIANFKDANKY